MKRFKFSFLLLFTVLVVGINSYAKDKNTTKTEKVYMFGFSASFNDSLVYITDIQGVDSVEIEPKTDFLVGRTAYGNQLQFYLADYKERPNTTCVVFFDKKEDKLRKKYNKILKRYKNSKETILKNLTRDEFSFKREINKVISE
ncbi:MAG: hypothetical protein H9789_03180 [Candidatus Paraprevotella stercoravium]|jgi:hypothetical protein|uniref:DUF4369 domain-containing protein n=2 Tax=Bacteroidales TaxID=171549 RepID=A0ABT7U1U6_9BACE|nr:hypothetical protein [Candidatus Paraprevotella stercoravium]MDM8144494.1 hypothetical protein [Bacteroides eggerthii]